MENPLEPKAVPDGTQSVPVSKRQDNEDEKSVKHGREINRGFKIGQYLQAPPFFFTRDKWPLPLVDHYRGAACFLIAGGPSFAEIDKTKLSEPGILTLGMNNSAKTFRPNLWTCVDDPANFIQSIWLDPKIQKIVPISHTEKTIFDSDNWQMTNTKVGDCPNVMFYKRNEMFQASQFLWEDTINWGNHTNLGGGRSVMLAAIRILWLLGIRRVYLLGVDFKMDANTKYHFEQNRTQSSIKGNNATYEQLNERFSLLRPIMEQQGYHIFNCNKDSNLKAFDFMSFDEAYANAKQAIPDIVKERTEGMYDRKANEREVHKNAAKAAGPPKSPQKEKGKPCDNCSRKYVTQVNAQLNAARTALHEAKGRTEAMKAMMQANNPAGDGHKLNTLVRDEENKRKAYRQLLKVRDNIVGAK